jgi:hypothetical protein
MKSLNNELASRLLPSLSLISRGTGTRSKSSSFILIVFLLIGLLFASFAFTVPARAQYTVTIVRVEPTYYAKLRFVSDTGRPLEWGAIKVPPGRDVGVPFKMSYYLNGMAREDVFTYEGVTLLDGTFTVRCPAGDYLVVAWWPNFRDIVIYKGIISIRANLSGLDLKTQVYDLTLNFRTPKGTICSGATAYIKLPQNVTVAEGTDSEGNIKLINVPSSVSTMSGKKYSLKVERATWHGYDALTAAVEKEITGTTTYYILADNIVALNVRVVGAKGQGLSYASVTLEPILTVVADGSGQASVELPRRTYRVTATYKGKTSSVSVDLTDRTKVVFDATVTLDVWIELFGYAMSAGEFALSALLSVITVPIVAFPVHRYIAWRRRRIGTALLKAPEGRAGAEARIVEGVMPAEEVGLKKVTEVKVPGFPQELLMKYEPLELIGEGGFAKAFKVKRRSDGKAIALKVLKGEGRASEVLAREVAAWLSLDHENIARLYAVSKDPIPHLEVELAEGVRVGEKVVRDLGDLPKPVDEGTAIKLVRGIAEGLKHAHSKGIFHRDLKPQNILLSSDFKPKITDWGLAKVKAASASPTSARAFTLLYAAPEQLDSRQYGPTDQRTDIFQLGLIFYELLSGRLPFEVEGGPYQIMGSILSPEPFQPVSRFNAKLSTLDWIVSKMLAKRKEDRFQSVEELTSALDQLERGTFRMEELRRTLKRA